MGYHGRARWEMLGTERPPQDISRRATVLAFLAAAATSIAVLACTDGNGATDGRIAAEAQIVDIEKLRGRVEQSANSFEQALIQEVQPDNPETAENIFDVAVKYCDEQYNPNVQGPSEFFDMQQVAQASNPEAGPGAGLTQDDFDALSDAFSSMESGENADFGDAFQGYCGDMQELRHFEQQ